MRTLLRAARACLVAAAACLPASGAARADDPAPPSGMGGGGPGGGDEPEAAAAALDGKIKSAIERGVAFLRKQQFPDGSWGDIGTHVKTYAGGSDVWQHPLGPTAMALYAMLKCDVPAADPAVKRGFEWLGKRPLVENTSAYECSAALLAVTATADPFKKTKDSRAAGEKVRLAGPMRKWAADLQAALVARRSPRGWRYRKNCPDPGGTEDVSSTQMALLALTSADRCGLATDPAVYADAAAYVLTLQEPDGPQEARAVRPRPGPAAGAAKPPTAGGGYAPPAGEKPPTDRDRGFHYSVHPTAKDYDQIVTGARTACGIGALALARWALDGGDPKAVPRRAGRPDSKAIEQAIYDGLAWLSAKWSPWENPGYSQKQVFYLYSVERAMDLVGAERLGEHLWYLEMVESLLPRQDERGSWDTKDPQVGDRNPVVDTAFALLFLRRAAKGGVPVPIVTGGDDAPPTDGR